MKKTLATIILSSTALHAQAQILSPAKESKPELPKLTPEQTTSILKQLDEIEGKFNTSRGGILGLALTRCKDASKSEAAALELYIACYKMEHFDKMNLKATDFNDWKQRNADKFKDPEFLFANWLQVRYLTAAIQAQDAKDDKALGPIVASVQSIVADAVSGVTSSTKHTTAGTVKEAGASKKGAKGGNFGSAQFQRLLHESVRNSEFSKAFQLADYLTREEWEYAPLSLQNVYEKIIFPYYLSGKPSDLGAQWDLLIKQQLATKAATMTESEYSIYYKERYPELLWRRAKYLFSHNVNPVLAMADMLKVIRENPTHPTTGDWIKELRDLVNQAQPGGSPPERTLAPAAGGN